MNRPEDIPERVWAEANAILDAYLSTPIGPTESIARAILAAEKRVREECAAYMDKRGDELEASSDTNIGRMMANIYRAEAAAIRKGGQDA